MEKDRETSAGQAPEVRVCCRRDTRAATCCLVCAPRPCTTAADAKSCAACVGQVFLLDGLLSALPDPAAAGTALSGSSDCSYYSCDHSADYVGSASNGKQRSTNSTPRPPSLPAWGRQGLTRWCAWPCRCRQQTEHRRCDLSHVHALEWR